MRRRDLAEATGAIWVDSGATHPGATGLEAPGDSLPLIIAWWRCAVVGA